MALKKFKDFNFNKTLKNKKKEIRISNSNLRKDNMENDVQELNDEIKKLKNKIKITDDIELVGINDISTEDPFKKNPKLKESADLGNKDINRGDILYITAMVKKKNVTWNSMAVIKVRIVDIYQGLSILNTLK